MRQHDGAANLLVSVTAVNAQTHMQLNGLVKLGLGGLAAQIHGLFGIIQFGTVEQLGAVDVMLAVFHSFILLLWLNRIVFLPR